jgi:hypothetical protein
VLRVGGADSRNVRDEDPRALGEKFTFSLGLPRERVRHVVPSSSSPPRRLSDLTAALPADRTLQNLLDLLLSKLQLCSRLPIYEYEAANEGHEGSAKSFHEIADRERESFAELLDCLRHHLDETIPQDRHDHERDTGAQR